MHNLEKNLIHCEEVTVACKVTYLNTILDKKLSFEEKTDAIVRQGQQRVYLLPEAFSVDGKILSFFHIFF